MNKLKKSQILMLSMLAALLVITPLLSSSLRTTYLYFIINLLIIALGAEAGLLSAFTKPPNDKKPASVAAKSVPLAAHQETSTEQAKVITSPNSEKKDRTIEKSSSEKIPLGTIKEDKVKKCPSMPSLFFIGSGETEGAEDQAFAEELYEEEGGGEEEEFTDGIGRQELFNKAEMFIGDFYKQLKLQREESWKRTHGFYQKAF